jgi:hypothetical protein
MAATELQKWQAMQTKAHAQANAGFALSVNVEMLLNHELPAEKMREELAKFLEDWKQGWDKAIDDYVQTGIKLGEI